MMIPGSQNHCEREWLMPKPDVLLTSILPLMSRIPATNEVSISSHSHILAEFRKAVAPTTDQSSPGRLLFLSKIHLIADYVPTRSTGFRLVTDVSFMRQRSKRPARCLLH